jgi:hypothetical protein
MYTYQNKTETPTATWTPDSQFCVCAGYNGYATWIAMKNGKRVHEILTDDYEDASENIQWEVRASKKEGYWLNELHRTHEADEQTQAALQNLRQGRVHHENATREDKGLREGAMIEGGFPDEANILFTGARSMYDKRQMKHNKKKESARQEVRVAIQRAAADDARKKQRVERESAESMYQEGLWMVAQIKSHVEDIKKVLQQAQTIRDACKLLCSRVHVPETPVTNLQNLDASLKQLVWLASQSQSLYSEAKLTLKRKSLEMIKEVGRCERQTSWWLKTSNYYLDQMKEIEEEMKRHGTTDGQKKSGHNEAVAAEQKQAVFLNDFPDPHREQNLLETLFGGNDQALDGSDTMSFKLSILCEGAIKIERIHVDDNFHLNMQYKQSWYGSESFKGGSIESAPGGRTMEKRMKRYGDGMSEWHIRWETEAEERKKREMKDLFERTGGVKRTGVPIGMQGSLYACMACKKEIPSHLLEALFAQDQPLMITGAGGLNDILTSNGETHLRDIEEFFRKNPILRRDQKELLKMAQTQYAAIQRHVTRKENVKAQNHSRALENTLQRIRQLNEETLLNENMNRKDRAEWDFQKAGELVSEKPDTKRDLTPFYKEMEAAIKALRTLREGDENFQHEYDKFISAMSQMQNKHKEKRAKEAMDLEKTQLKVAIAGKRDLVNKLILKSLKRWNKYRGTNTDVAVACNKLESVQASIQLKNQWSEFSSDSKTSLEEKYRSIIDSLNTVEQTTAKTNEIVEELEKMDKIRSRTEEIAAKVHESSNEVQDMNSVHGDNDEEFHNIETQKEQMDLLVSRLKNPLSLQEAQSALDDLEKSFSSFMKSVRNIEYSIKQTGSADAGYSELEEVPGKRSEQNRNKKNPGRQAQQQASASEVRDFVKNKHVPSVNYAMLRKRVKPIANEHSKWMVRFVSASTPLSSIATCHYDDGKDDDLPVPEPQNNESIPNDEQQRIAFLRSRNLRRYTLTFKSKTIGGVKNYDVINMDDDASTLPEYAMLIDSVSWLPVIKSSPATMEEMERYRNFLMFDIDSGAKVPKATLLHVAQFHYVPTFGYGYVAEHALIDASGNQKPWASALKFDTEGILARHALEHVSVSHNGQWIAVARWDGRCMVFEVRLACTIARPCAFHAHVSRVFFSILILTVPDTLLSI